MGRGPRVVRRFPRREDVLGLVQDGLSYAEIGERLGVHPGLAYLIGTGLPADGSDSPSANTSRRRGVLSTSQHLSSPTSPHNPTQREEVHAWIRQRVADDAAMRAAAAAHVPGAVPGRRQADEGDLVDVLGRDHNLVNALLKQLTTIPGLEDGGSPAHLSARQRIVDRVTAELGEHETLEQERLWPLVRISLDDGDALADEGEAQERHGAQILARLSPLTAGDDEFDELVEELSGAVRRHVAFEDTVFLRLRERVPGVQLRRLATEEPAEERDD